LNDSIHPLGREERRPRAFACGWQQRVGEAAQEHTVKTARRASGPAKRGTRRLAISAPSPAASKSGSSGRNPSRFDRPARFHKDLLEPVAPHHTPLPSRTYCCHGRPPRRAGCAVPRGSRERGAAEPRRRRACPLRGLPLRLLCLQRRPEPPELRQRRTLPPRLFFPRSDFTSPCSAGRFHLSTRTQEGDLGTVSLGILYTSFTLFSVVARMGPSRALVVGTTGYLFFILANLVPAWCVQCLSCLRTATRLAKTRTVCRGVLLWNRTGPSLVVTPNNHCLATRFYHKPELEGTLVLWVVKNVS
jgi:hypothetical protein